MAKKQSEPLKIMSIALIALLILNIILMAAGLIKPLTFWIIIIMVGIFAYWVLPRWRK